MYNTVLYVHPPMGTCLITLRVPCVPYRIQVAARSATQHQRAAKGLQCVDNVFTKGNRCRSIGRGDEIDYTVPTCMYATTMHRKRNVSAVPAALPVYRAGEICGDLHFPRAPDYDFYLYDVYRNFAVNTIHTYIYVYEYYTYTLYVHVSRYGKFFLLTIRSTYHQFQDTLYIVQYDFIVYATHIYIYLPRIIIPVTVVLYRTSARRIEDYDS